ncbi:hypothetical protein EFR84_28840 [Rhizobium chutanense]|uniref:Uncharacterized protein n=1 Tax=Rhizobium chutanense TaxID=2035448 RepID=A0A432NFQ2_9HYPH|nr:hypothetical protein EFR84_28840 [Rhizobium chutanense]
MYGTVRTVVWEEGRRKAPSYPINNRRDGLFRACAVKERSCATINGQQFTRLGEHAGNSSFI